MFEFRNVKKIVNFIAGIDMLYCTFKVNASATCGLPLPDENDIIQYHIFVRITPCFYIYIYI